MKPEEKKASEAIQDILEIANSSAQAIIAVVGPTLNRFPTDKHLASWAGLSPGNNESARRRKSGRTTKGNNLLRDTLVICAHSAVRNKESYFYAQFQRISSHRGKKRAYVAVAHSMLIAIYHILKDDVVLSLMIKHMNIIRICYFQRKFQAFFRWGHIRHSPLSLRYLLLSLPMTE